MSYYEILIKWGNHDDECEYLVVTASNRSEAYDKAMNYIENNYSELIKQYAQIMEIHKENINE